MSRYDEDLFENPFFAALVKQYPNLFNQATTNRWVMCIPKFSIVEDVQLVKKDFEDHILVSQPEQEETYTTLSQHIVHIKQGQIELGTGFEDGRKVHILFEEMCYNENDESYRVLCVSSFFNREVKEEVGGSPTNLSQLKATSSYDEFMRILWGHTDGLKTKVNLDKTLRSFCSTYQKLEGQDIIKLVDLVATQVTAAMQIILKDSNLRHYVHDNEMRMTTVKVAVEMYLMNAVHKHLFSTITSCVREEDAILNKVTRNLSGIRLSQLGVRKEFEENILHAKKEIAKLNHYSTPTGRVMCLSRVLTALSRPITGAQDVVMTTDDLLPLLMYLIIKSQIPNWKANLTYMKNFQQNIVGLNDEFSFLLANTEAALDYIKNDNLKTSQPLKDAPALSRQTSGSSTSSKEKFFQYVKYGDEAAVRLMLKKTPSVESEDVLSKLCHPLCTCDKCTSLVARNKQSSGTVSLLARDDMGRTALHIAANYGQANLIDILAKHGSLADATDYLGCTPLHLACQNGFQNVILLLVHFGADIRAVDNEGNTPLHMCAKNGHEDCVKAILFLDILKNRLNVNAQNDMGDTPLHLAAKWGYEGIVKFLLDTEADTMVRNRKRQLPMNLAQNSAIKRELEASITNPPPLIINHPVPKPPPTKSKAKPPATLPDITTQPALGNQSSEGFQVVDVKQRKPPVALIDNSDKRMMSPTTPEVVSLDQADIRQKERLFQAIKNKDLQLVKFYLGWVETEVDEEESPVSPQSGASLCHPLCQCEKCQPLQKKALGNSLHVNCQNQLGTTPTHIAVMSNNMEALVLFLKKGANINMQTKKGITPLHQACHWNRLQMVKKLIDAGADLSLKDEFGELPIHLACAKGSFEIVQYLIQNSSPVQVANVVGNTPLHLAAMRNYLPKVTLLLASGAAPETLNKDHLSPMDVTESPEVKHLLQEKINSIRERALAFSKLRSEVDKMEASLTSSQDKTTPRTPHIDTELGTSIRDFPKFGSLKKSKTFDHSAPCISDLSLKLSLSIQHFDKPASLRRTRTLDRGASALDSVKHSWSIQHFDSSTLKHVELTDKSSPMHLFSLERSYSMYHNFSDYLPEELESETEKQENAHEADEESETEKQENANKADDEICDKVCDEASSSDIDRVEKEEGLNKGKEISESLNESEAADDYKRQTEEIYVEQTCDQIPVIESFASLQNDGGKSDKETSEIKDNSKVLEKPIAVCDDIEADINSENAKTDSEESVNVKNDSDHDSKYSNSVCDQANGQEIVCKNPNENDNVGNDVNNSSNASINADENIAASCDANENYSVCSNADKDVHTNTNDNVIASSIANENPDTDSDVHETSIEIKN